MSFLVLTIYDAIFSPKIDRRFHLLGLPRVAFDNIYQYLGFEDIIVLAACSKRTQDFIKAKEAFLKKLTACELFIGARSRNIKLEDVGRFPNRGKFAIDILTKNRVQSLGNSMADQVDELYETDVLHVADKMVLNIEQISNSLMKHILDNVEARDLSLRACPLSNFRYDNALTRCSKISLCTPFWLSMEQVWEMVQSGVQQMNFSETVSWPNTEFNQFLKNWLNSTNRTLEYMKFAFEKKVCIPAIVLDGIETLPAAEGNGRVICRGDGVRATIVLQGDSSYYSTLTVCYDPISNL